MQMISLRHTLASERDAALAQARTFMQAAEKDNRELSAEERDKVQSHLDAAKAIKDRIDALTGDDEMRAQLQAFQPAAADQPQRGLTPVTPGVQTERALMSLGQQLIASAVYRDRIKGAARPRGWTSGVIDLEFTPRAALLDSTQGGALKMPTYTPGILPIMFARPVVADLIAPGQTDTSAVIYFEEITATNNAGPVEEGELKPESALAFVQKTDLVKKIATWLPVTDEMLDDVPQLRSYVDSRLVLFVQLEEEDQILNGDGLNGAITGIRNRVGLAPDVPRTPGTAPDPGEPNADAIFRQIMAIASTAFVMPDGVVVNPANWQSIVLSKDANGNYQAGGPFGALTPPRLWGLPVVATPAMPAGTALVGAYGTAAQMFRKGGIAVEASNSHADYFIRNITAIRAEERFALAVYRPGAFGEVTGLV